MMTRYMVWALFTMSRLALGNDTVLTQEVEPTEVIPLAISDLVPTTVQFPSPLDAVIGVGVIEGGSEPANFQLNHNGDWFAIRALRPGVVTRLNVLWKGDFYVFEVKHSLTPVSVMTCTPKAQAARKMVEIFARSYKGPIHLETSDLLKLVHRVEALDFTDGYECEYNQLVSRRLSGKESFGELDGELTRVAYFRRYGLFVFLARLFNHTDDDVFFEPRNLGVRVADMVRLNHFSPAEKKIRGGETLRVSFVIRFAKDHPTPVSISNDFALVVQPAGSMGEKVQ